MDEEQLVAMMVAAIAEDSGTDADRIRVVSFRKAEPTPLEKYLRETGYPYKKYTLEERQS